MKQKEIQTKHDRIDSKVEWRIEHPEIPTHAYGSLSFLLLVHVRMEKFFLWGYG